MAARSLQESMSRQLSGQARPANWGGAGGLTFVARLPGLTFYVQSSLNAACLRTCPIWSEGEGKWQWSLFTWIYTCGSLWVSATARSGLLSSRYSNAVCCPRASPHPCRRSHRLAHGVPEGSKRSHPSSATAPCARMRQRAGRSSHEGIGMQGPVEWTLGLELASPRLPRDERWRLPVSPWTRGGRRG
jgi:hypothetical protein